MAKRKQAFAGLFGDNVKQDEEYFHINRRFLFEAALIVWIVILTVVK